MSEWVDTTVEIDGLRRSIAAIEGRIEPVARAVGGQPSRGWGTGARSVVTDERRANRDVGGSALGGGATAKGGDGVSAEGGCLSFGEATLDRRLGPSGGLSLGALHECLGGATGAASALSGFATALVGRLSARRDGWVLWISTAAARREGGGLHALGLLGAGCDPGRVVEVAVERPEEALWAFEEGLSCRGTAAIVAEIPGDPDVLDLTATRRLALRANRGGDGAEGSGRALALLLRSGGVPQSTAAATRWRIAAARSRQPAGFALGLGRPAFAVELDKNRDGRVGRFVLEWNPDERRFSLLPAHSVALSPSARDRPTAPAGGGQVVAFETGRLLRGGEGWARGEWGGEEWGDE